VKIPKEKQNVAPRQPLDVRTARRALELAVAWNENDILAYEDCAPTMVMLEARRKILRHALRMTK